LDILDSNVSRNEGKLPSPLILLSKEVGEDREFNEVGDVLDFIRRLSCIDFISGGPNNFTPTTDPVCQELSPLPIFILFY
jgi:hypothetical protein